MVERVCTVEEFLNLEPIERLAFARKQIEREDRAWNQGNWLSLEYRDLLTEKRAIPGVLEDSRMCGTAACLAGWVCILAGERIIHTGSIFGCVDGSSFRQRSDELLGLDGVRHDLYRGSNDLETIDREIARLNEEVYR